MNNNYNKAYFTRVDILRVMTVLVLLKSFKTQLLCIFNYIRKLESGKKIK